MKVINVALLTVSFFALPAWRDTVLAKPPHRDEQQVRAEHAAIASAFSRSDIPALRRLLHDVSFFAKPAAAMSLARLNAVEALPELGKLNDEYAQFPCAETGDFGIAVVLLEQKNTESEKNMLLKIATSDQRNGDWPASVVDRAGRELAVYGDDSTVEPLSKVNTYGAQYTEEKQRGQTSLFLRRMC